MRRSVEGRLILKARDRSGGPPRGAPVGAKSRLSRRRTLDRCGPCRDSSGPVIEVHGQHGQQTMLRTCRPSRCARPLWQPRRGNARGHPYRTASVAQADLARTLGGDELARNREIDLLQFQVDEIDAVAQSLMCDEDERLAEREEMLGRRGGTGRCCRGSDRDCCR